MTSVAVTLARWAADLPPSPGDLELAHRSLLDTVAVTLAARDHRVTRLAAGLPEGARWAVAGHVLDFDDLHMPSTTHVSAVCVPTALATGGGEILRASQQYPPGSPARPPTAAQLQAKLAGCVAGLDTDPAAWTWDNAATTLRRYLR